MVTMDKPTALEILEYLDRVTLGGPGTKGMHQERLEMNRIVGVLTDICNAPDDPPPTPDEGNDDE